MWSMLQISDLCLCYYKHYITCIKANKEGEVLGLTVLSAKYILFLIYLFLIVCGFCISRTHSVLLKNLLPHHLYPAHRLALVFVISA